MPDAELLQGMLREREQRKVNKIIRNHRRSWGHQK